LAHYPSRATCARGRKARPARVGSWSRLESIIFASSLAPSHRCNHIDPTLLTAAERLQYEGYLGREETKVVRPSRLCRKAAYPSSKRLFRPTESAGGFVRRPFRPVVCGAPTR